MIIEKLIRTLKGDPNYKWENAYSTRDLLHISSHRAIQAIRGLFLKPFFKKSSGLIFVGSRVKVLHAYRITAGKNLLLGDNVSIDALSENGIYFGDHVSIARDSILFCTGVIAQKGTGITIGDRTGIGARAFLAGQGGITIGNDVITGPNLQVFSENHNFSDPELIIKEQGVAKQPTFIGNNCWIGGGVSILAGVTIGNGCVIAAGSVVTKSVEANSIVAGVPAKVIKKQGLAMPKPLNIAIDIRDLRLAKTGTHTYLEELCNAFKKMDDDTIRFHFLDTGIPVYTGNKKVLKLIEHARYLLWKQVILPLKAYSKNCKIVFCTDNFVPLIHLGYKTIPVFHDAFFFETPQNYGKLWLQLYRQTAIPAAMRSAFVVTPTHFAKNQISHFTQIAPEKLVVVYEGPKDLDNETSNNADELLNSLKLSANNFVLHVGAMYKRKNLPALIHAFSRLSPEYPELKLVLAGSAPSSQIDNDYPEVLATINKTGLQNKIVLTGYLPDYALGHLYRNARLYVFPSINEGFGIPVLEAFKYNLPVLVANNTCLPEVGGDAVLTFDPFDTDDISLKIKSVLNDEVLRREMIIKGRERLKHFSWQQAAAQLVQVFKKATNGH